MSGSLAMSSIAQDKQSFKDIVVDLGNVESRTKHLRAALSTIFTKL